MLSDFERGQCTLPKDRVEALGEILTAELRRRHDQILDVIQNSSIQKGASVRERIDEGNKQLTAFGRGRRAFLRVSKDVSIAVAGAAAFDMLKSFLLPVCDPAADKRPLESLFGIYPQEGSADLIAAADHPFMRPTGADWYPTEGRNCESYRQRFLGRFPIRQVRFDPEIMPTDGLILFGSQVSNKKTLEYFGRFLREKPQLKIHGRSWSVKLHWNLYTPDSAETMERIQFGRLWKTWRHKFGGLGGDFQSTEQRGDLVDDFLLVTSLPRRKIGKERILVFAGLHGPGQKATDLLLGQPSTSMLRNVVNGTRGEPFYQALFHVTVAKGADGEVAPRDIQLVEALPLEPIFS